MEDKKKKVTLIITIIFIAVLVIGATYAYFVAQTGEGKSTDIEISANTVDTFSFAVGDPLKFTADQFTFTEGGTNATATTYAKAILTANNKTNTVTEHYYLYLNISNNTFGYSQDSTKPELLLQITDKSGNAITSLTGLEYKTVTNGAGTEISGFDVTTKSGLITILNNREITTTSTLEEQWNVTLTFVNYEFNQASNGGKSFSAKLIIQKEEISLLISNVTTSQIQKNWNYDLTVNVETISTSGEVSKFYYSNDNGKTFVESTLSTYTFYDFDFGESYSIVIYATDANGNKTEQYMFDYTPEILGRINELTYARYDIDTETLGLGFNYTSKYALSKICIADNYCVNMSEVTLENDVFKFYFSKDNFKSETFDVILQVFDVKGNEFCNYDVSSFSISKYN